MVLGRAGEKLSLREVAIPSADNGQVLLRVRACGVCRTDLHIVDGELERPKLPLIPGDQIVLAQANEALDKLRRGDVRGALVLVP
jgi:propanol-preferring alcohol dehydrogenase